MGTVNARRAVIKGQLRGIKRQLNAAQEFNRRDSTAMLAIMLLSVEERARAARRSLAALEEPTEAVSTHATLKEQEIMRCENALHDRS